MKRSLFRLFTEHPASPGEEPISGDLVLYDEICEPFGVDNPPGMVEPLLGEVATIDLHVLAESIPGQSLQAEQFIEGFEEAIGY